MEGSAFLWFRLALLFPVGAIVRAQQVLPANSTAWQLPSDPGNNVELETSSSVTPQNWTLVPLSSLAADKIKSNVPLNGRMIVANPQMDNVNFQNVMAYVSCDPSDYPGNIGIDRLVDSITSFNATAIVFYSLRAAQCQMISNATTTLSDYSRAFSMASASDSQSVLSILGASGSSTHGASTFNIGTDRALKWSQTEKTSESGGTTATAVAMIILYSVTGIITILFLLIIIVGTVRARRHPERYGLRNAAGLSNQSRAKGIARAMLDTLPIVKFTTTTPAKSQDTSDIEMQTSKHSVRDQNIKEGLKGAVSVSVEERQAAQDSSLPRSGRTASIGWVVADEIAASVDRPICSICTDDFEHGQDLRVLPCQHHFHPACVDPWLLEVSGTCPLCRIDLHSNASTTEADVSQEQASPLSTSSTPVPLDSRSRLLHLLRRLRSATAEERTAALRQYRENGRF